MYISLLTDDYLKPSGRFTRNFIGESREAPAVFKQDGKYYMLSSGCTGWNPNVAEIAVADSIMGEWRTLGNPCTGPDADKTFYAAEHLCATGGRKKERLYSDVRSLEEDRFGRFALCVVTHTDRRWCADHTLA